MPWEQGIMPFPPHQRQFFVPSRPVPDTYSIDVYIVDWEGMFPEMKKTGASNQHAVHAGVHGQKLYKAVCKTGTKDNCLSVLETKLINPDHHNGFHEWGRLDDYKLPSDYMLPDALLS